MSEQKHTQEPWREGKSSPFMTCVVSDEEIEGIDGANEVAYYGGNLIAESVTPDNARRIVACVNACAGLDDVYLSNTSLYQLERDYSGLFEHNEKVEVELARLQSENARLEEKLAEAETQIDTIIKHHGDTLVEIDEWGCRHDHPEIGDEIGAALAKIKV